MLRTIQIMTYLKSQGFSKAEIIDYVGYLVDNNESEYFDLNDNDFNNIAKVFNDDRKFEGALMMVGL